MATENKQQLLEELVLLVMYLSSWTEKNSSIHDMPRAWKGYDFAIIDELKEKGFIDFSFKAKSLSFTEKGVEQSKLWLSKYENRG